MSDEARLLAEIHAVRALMRAQGPAARITPIGDEHDSSPIAPATAGRWSSAGRMAPDHRPGAMPIGTSHAALWAHATRGAGRPVDLAVMRAIRGDPETARRYRTMLGAQAIAHAPLAAAASDGALTRRRVGPFELEILEGEDGAPPLLVLRGAQARPPRTIEAWLGEEGVRLDLGSPVEGAILLALDAAVPEADALGRMLRDPACAVFLL